MSSDKSLKTNEIRLSERTLSRLDYAGNVRDAIQRRKGRWKYIAKRAGVSYPWLRDFMRDRWPANVALIERVARVLPDFPPNNNFM